MLGRRRYLKLASAVYFEAFRRGFLRDDPAYAWHNFVTELIEPGDVVLDIGANLGYFARIFAEAVGPRGQLWCVEPIEIHRSILAAGLRPFPNARIIPYALGKEPRSIPMGTFTEVPFRHGLTREVTAEKRGEMEVIEVVEMRRPDDVFSALTRMDYVKCDVEGAEPDIFEAMAPLLERFLPLVQVEMTKHNRDQLRSLFTSMGYEPYALEKRVLRAIGSADEFIDGDWLWVPKPREARVKAYMAA